MRVDAVRPVAAAEHAIITHSSANRHEKTALTTVGFEGAAGGGASSYANASLASVVADDADLQEELQEEIAAAQRVGGWLLVNNGEGTRRDAYVWIHGGVPIALVPIPAERED